MSLMQFRLATASYRDGDPLYRLSENGVEVYPAGVGPAQWDEVKPLRTLPLERVDVEAARQAVAADLAQARGTQDVASCRPEIVSISKKPLDDPDYPNADQAIEERKTCSWWVDSGTFNVSGYPATDLGSYQLEPNTLEAAADRASSELGLPRLQGLDDASVLSGYAAQDGLERSGFDL